MNVNRMRIFFISIIFLVGLTGDITAQFSYEKTKMDSFLHVISNPDATDTDRIESMARLSQIYTEQGDSVNAATFIANAYALARKQKDSKYMIYVYSQKLMNSLNRYPKNITLIYKLIDSIYTAINTTADLEVQAFGYDCIGMVKKETDKGYNLDDLYKALFIAEKLPEKSTKKYTIMVDIYRSLVALNLYKNKSATEKYLNLLHQTAKKSGNKDALCIAMTQKLLFVVYYSPNEKRLIFQNFKILENFLSNNIHYIDSFDYGFAVGSLMMAYEEAPNAQFRKLLDKHISIYRTIAGNSLKNRKALLTIELNNAHLQKNYPETIKRINELIKIEEIIAPSDLWLDYKHMADVYSEMKQYELASKALNKSLNYYKQYENSQTEEMRQLYYSRLLIA